MNNFRYFNYYFLVLRKLYIVLTYIFNIIIFKCICYFFILKWHFLWYMIIYILSFVIINILFIIIYFLNFDLINIFHIIFISKLILIFNYIITLTFYFKHIMLILWLSKMICPFLSNKRCSYEISILWYIKEIIKIFIYALFFFNYSIIFLKLI